MAWASLEAELQGDRDNPPDCGGLTMRSGRHRIEARPGSDIRPALEASPLWNC